MIAARAGNIRAKVEQVVLYPRKHRIGAFRGGGATGNPDRGVGFVDVSLRMNAQGVFRDAAAVTERGFAAVAALMGVVMLGGCVTDGSTGMKQGAGTLLGAGLGGLVGSKIGGGRGQLAAVAAGALLGGFMGNEVGASLDRADQMYQQRAQNTALHTADWQPVAWSNPDSGNSGTITPVRTMQNANTGEVCREYQTSVTIGGRVEQG